MWIPKRLRPVKPASVAQIMDPIDDSFVAIPADKGVFGGHCNVGNCLAANATWYNSMTQSYYCPRCARRINEENMAGIKDMCTPGRCAEDGRN